MDASLELWPWRGAFAAPLPKNSLRSAAGALGTSPVTDI